MFSVTLSFSSHAERSYHWFIPRGSLDLFVRLTTKATGQQGDSKQKTIVSWSENNRRQEGQHGSKCVVKQK
ncbi:hypothetical protein FHG87_012664 [Trinorchestia longiramus]|nr:hypothetical protein FHG87_012664 [Trinorchestia longiramus]